MVRAIEERDRLFEENYGLIGFVVNSKLGYAWKGKTNQANYSYDDIFQMVSIGLMKACEKFNPIEFPDVKFSTYAVQLMVGEWKRYMRDKGTSVNFSRSIKLDHYRIVTMGLENAPYEVIAKELGMSTKQVIDAFNYKQNLTTLSTDGTMKNDGDTDGDKKELRFGDMFSARDDYSYMEVDSFMDKLDDREKFILEQITSGIRQDAIGKILGISQVQVSRIIRNKIRPKAVEHFELAIV